MRGDQAAPRNSESSSLQLKHATEQPLVIIVDDDASVREALSELILSAGFRPECFASTYELLDADLLHRPGCLILDVRMPGGSGLDLQHHLVQSGNRKPIIFLTGHGDIPMTVQAMKAGAVDFLTKPVRDQALLDAVSAGIAMDAMLRAETVVVKRNLERLNTLTPRERQVLAEVARGRLNKQIAFDLGISEVTVKLHRSNVMRKMEVASIGELIRAWETLPAAVRDIGATQPIGDSPSFLDQPRTSRIAAR
jgi:FixJ family two-component response regulator